MPGLVVEWRCTQGTTAPAWDALCIMIDGDRSWLEWFARDEMRPISIEPPAD